MHQNWKRFLSIIMALAMVMSLLTTTAWATEEEAALSDVSMEEQATTGTEDEETETPPSDGDTQEKQTTPATYTVTYEVGEYGTTKDIMTEDVEENATPQNPPSVTAEEGFEFTGWMLNEKVVELSALSITESITLTARYSQVEVPNATEPKPLEVKTATEEPPTPTDRTLETDTDAVAETEITEIEDKDTTSTIPLMNDVTTIISGETYTISNKDELNHFAQLVNDGQTCKGTTIKLLDDIALGYWRDDNGNGSMDDGEIFESESFETEYTESNWTPIGDEDDEHEFMGTFDGNGHTISGIYLDATEAALFGYASEAVIKNVVVSESYLSGDYCAGIVNVIDNTIIQNCTNTATVIARGSEDDGNGMEDVMAGGILVDVYDSIIQNCMNSGYVSGNCHDGHDAGIVVGGIAASVDQCTVQNCINSGNISAKGNLNNGNGGICGMCEGGSIQYCYNTGIVTSSIDRDISEETMNFVGGITGVCISDGTIESCTNTGTVSGIGIQSQIGGIVGGQIGSSTVETCINTGKVSGSDWNGIGGIVGENVGNIVHCTNAGTVSGSGFGNAIGGVVGHNNTGTIETCTNTGTVRSTHAIIGGIVGLNNADTVENCYYDKQMCPVSGGINGNDEEGKAEGKLTTEMVGTSLQDDTASNPWGSANWSFEDGMYPRLTGMADTDTAIVSATPVFLADEDTVSNVTQSFTVGTDNGVSWTSSNLDVISISGSSAIITRQDSDSSVNLTASKNEASRTVELKVSAATGNEVQVPANNVKANGVTATAILGAVKYEKSNTATVTILLSGTAEKAGTHTVGLTSDKAGDITPPDSVTKEISAGDGLEDLFVFTFIMPEAPVDDIKVTHTFEPEPEPDPDPDPDPDPEPADGSSHHHHHHSTPSNGADIIVNGKTKTAGTTATKTRNGKKQTTVTIDNQKLKSVLKSEGNGASVIVPITSNVDIATGSLNGQMVKDMEKKEAVLEIETNSANYTLPASEIDIDQVSRQYGETVALSDIDVEISIAEPSDETVTVVETAAETGDFSIVCPAVDFAINCSYKGKTIPVSNFNSYVERMVAVPAGVDPNKITTGIVVHADGTTHHVPTKVTIIDGNYYAKINSLTNSTYTVVYNPVEFSDVTGHWAKDAINDMGSRMVVSGIGNNQYAPDRDMTRAEFTAILVRAMGLDTGLGHESFPDVNEADWYCGSVETGVSYDLIKGNNDGTFAPYDKITREQAVVMIVRAMKKTGIKVELSEDEVTELLSQYSDTASVASYAKTSFATCIKVGIIQRAGTGALTPKENISRAEVAVMVQRLLQKAKLI